MDCLDLADLVMTHQRILAIEFALRHNISLADVDRCSKLLINRFNEGNRSASVIEVLKRRGDGLPELLELHPDPSDTFRPKES